jgi:hypothetical protein
VRYVNVFKAAGGGGGVSLNVEEALKATVDLLLGENSLPVKARCKDYIADEEVAALYNAIDILTEEYRHKDCVLLLTLGLSFGII